MKNAVFWDVAPCGSYRNRRFGETCSLHLQGRNPLAKKSVTLKIEVTRSSETSVLTRLTRRHILEDGILHSYPCENIKSYNRNVYAFLRARLFSSCLLYFCIYLSCLMHILQLNEVHLFCNYFTIINATVS
jgi:hypothetical protein